MPARTLDAPSLAAVSEKLKRAYAGFTPPVAWLIAVLYGLAVSLIPWDLIRGEPFIDLVTYIEGFESGAYQYLDALEGPAYLLSEPAWRAIVNGLMNLVGTVSASLQFLTFCVSAIYAYVVLRRSRATTFLLASPLLIDLLVSQVRSAVAGALFLIACLVGSTFLWLLVLTIGSLIHTSAAILCGLYALAFTLCRLAKTRPGIARVTVVGFSIVLPLLVAIAYAELLVAIGDRRAQDADAWPGGIFVVTMAVYYAVMLMNLRRVMMTPLAIYCLLISAMFIVLALLQVNGLRFVSLTYPLFLTTSLVLPYRHRLVVNTMFIVMCVYHFSLWI